jgi:two-component system CheB/CheR fusion protein
MTIPSAAGFETLLEFVHTHRGFDFTGYKRTSLMRRVLRRMQQVEISSFSEYLDFLQVQQDEFVALFNTILINVTGFFRDATSWKLLQQELLPELAAAKGPADPIRVWSAGCATGEEAYTLAIVLAEVLGTEQFRERVKIYATDVDEEALAQARTALYTEREMSGCPPEYVEKYFAKTGTRLAFRKDLRRCVIFGRNDLVQDAPISRIDLLACRNTLMYFNAETQAKILARLHFALADGGLLFLGRAEMLLSHASLFAPVDLKRRFFRKLPRVSPPERALLRHHSPPAASPEIRVEQVLRDQALFASTTALVVVSAAGRLVLSNSRADALFNLSRRDIGRPFQDLELSYRPAELRSLIQQAQDERRPVWAKDVTWLRPGGEKTLFEVQTVPLLGGDGGVLGVSIVFNDVTRYRRLQEELEDSNRRLETAYEELQSTVEELETTNEELQSTVEELETTNEELQSTNEELETTNEELQSTNDELRDRTDQLDVLNLFMQEILTSLPNGVVVVDRDLRIQVWNRLAEDMWGIRQDEAVGQHLLAVDIGLPTERLRPTLKSVLAGEDAGDVVLDAVNRRGRPIRVQVTATPLIANEQDPAGSVLVMQVLEP